MSGDKDDLGEAAGGQDTTSEPQPGKLEYAADSLLVRFKPSAASAQQRVAALERVQGSFEDANGDGIYDRFTNIDKTGALMKVDLQRGASVERAIELLRQDPAVLYAEPNYLVHALATPSDPRFGELWGLNNTGQTGGTADADIDAVEAWDTSTGSRDVVVAVIDTGVDYDHPDLAANIWTNPGEIAGNGLDDDGNGVIDDVHGFNAISNGGDPLDDNDHGTHCAGTLGAVGDNGVGIAGVNWQVSIMAIKFLSAGGSGTTADAIEGIDYAVGRKHAGVNLRVLSNSWGGGGFSQALVDSIQAANDADLMFVAAAGGSGSDLDVTPSYPASYALPNVVAVAATDHNDALASFSGYGAASVDLGAPGVNVLSTTRDNTYAVFSGTSMATPHVAGVAALVLAVNATLTTAQVKDLLLTSGDAKPSLAGKTVSGKRLNAAAALAAAGAPAPHFDLSAAPAARVVNQGETASFDLTATAMGSFSGAIALSASAEPALAAAITLSPSTITAPGASTLTVATDCATAPGSYVLTVTGSSGGTTRTAELRLTVDPFGTAELSYPSGDTPLPIPDNQPAGVDSTVTVPAGVSIASLRAEVHIAHTWIGDLSVALVGPNGQSVTLHNRAGGSADDLDQIYTVTDFDGQLAEGAWTLHVTDHLIGFAGTLTSWTLHVTSTAGPQPPVAAFAYAANLLSVAFTDESMDVGCGGGVIGWAWDFGDGATSTEANPTHAYAAPGTYTVTLTATNSDGLTDVASQTLTVTRPRLTLAIERVVRNRETYEFAVDLTWAGAEGALIELYRNGALVDLPDNDGATRDRFRRYETSFTWKICEQFSDECSNEVSVVFGSSADAATIVTKGADGNASSRVVTIEDLK